MTQIKNTYLDEELHEEAQKNLDKTEDLLKGLNSIDSDHICPECGNEISFGVVYDNEENDCEVEKGHDIDCSHMDSNYNL